MPGISVDENELWQVNREIAFTFSKPVDFSSISLNTISIQTGTGTPATGAFFLQSPNVVVFQPNCPTRVDLSDTGLVPGRVPYVIRVLGRSSGASNTVRSTTGEQLAVTQVRNFVTFDAGMDAFLDTAVGPPVPVVRAEGSSDLNATYIEVGGDPDNRVYFERDNAQMLVLSVPGFRAPLNLYSDSASKVAVVIEFNQAINPSVGNVTSDLLRMEFLDGLVWRPLETQVALVGNCTETGARVRLEPIGILPQGSQLRAVVLNGFQDLVGEETLSPNDTFAVVSTQVVDFTSLNPADTKSDEFLESFDFGGSSTLSFQDTGILSELPIASWGNGRLSAAFAFEGSGGPGGAFDWLVRNGDSFLLDTDSGVIVAEDGITTQIVTNGLVDVRNLTIEAGGTVRVQGSKALRINATGTVIIRGKLDVSGFAARDVQQLNTGDTRENGGAPGPGGGRGGNANEIITNSTPRGSFGQGPVPTVNAGGQGGETGFSSANTKDSRRPGGGAGGRFARNQGAGLTAQNGVDGVATAVGAVSGQAPPRGGVLSSGPFTDANDTNDFFGTRAVGSPGAVASLIRGELASLWGGYGGGGGGNANPAALFPTPNWTPASDEKGGAGGGGGGGLRIRSLGPIQFGAAGQIVSDGGRGAIGENILVEDHIGGNGGSGSGGHIILETATFLDFTDGGTANGTPSRDWIRAAGGPRIQGATTPSGNVSFGGAGGPGVIQLHVPRSLSAPSMDSMTSDIVVPIPALGANAIDNVTSPPGAVLIPAFGARSTARSRWISIGGADQNPGGIPSKVEFLFQGIETMSGNDEGKVLVSGETVQEIPALLDEDLEGNPGVMVLGDRRTVRLAGASLAPFSGSTNGIVNDVYLRTPTLLEDFDFRLSVNAVSQVFRVARATYDEGLPVGGDESLSLTVAEGGMDLQDFIDANTAQGVVHYELVPRFFRIETGGVEDALPANAFVRVRFQATGADGFDQPDENNLLVDWTGDISLFNTTLVAGQLQFFRFEVEFVLNALGGPVAPDTQSVSLQFLRIPFEF